MGKILIGYSNNIMYIFIKKLKLLKFCSVEILYYPKNIFNNIIFFLYVSNIFINFYQNQISCSKVYNSIQLFYFYY